MSEAYRLVFRPGRRTQARQLGPRALDPAHRFEELENLWRRVQRR